MRFRGPVPHKGWSGIRDASTHGNHCPNDGIAGIGAGGHEDCLFLNVYTQSLSGNLSCMAWLHGGAFIIGDGNSFVYGPDLLVRENVIVVTINYRLSALGFLSTGDKYAPGNYGLKDMVMALKWVKENIAAFGGDPKRVTLFGQSAGAVSIHMLLLSEMSKGLFHQAIIQSGTAIAPFGFQPRPEKHAEELGFKLGLKSNSSKSLITQLRGIDYREIMRAQRGILDMDKPLGLRSYDFTPTAEPEDSLEQRFLTDEPINLMINGSYRTVPMIIGTTNNEGLLMVREYLLDNQVFDRFNENEYLFVPQSFNLEEGSPEVKEVADVFRNLYFEGKNLSGIVKLLSVVFSVIYINFSCS